MPCRSEKIAGTFAQQLGWVFVGPCHPSAHGPPALILKRKKTQGRKREKFYIYLDVTHTHTLAQKCLIELLMWNASDVQRQPS